MKKISTNTKTIILSDGDLPSLLVASMEAEQLLRAPRAGLDSAADASVAQEPSESGGGCRVSIMPWPSSLTVHELQVEAARSHAGYFGLELLVPCMPWPGMAECNDLAGKPLSQLAEGLNQTLELVSAVYSAIASGATRVVWPIHFQNDTQTLAQDLEAIAAAVDKALLIGRLGLLEHNPDMPAHRQGLTIDTPLVDLTSRQLADLVVDMDIPVHLAWWCRSQPTTRTDRAAQASQQKQVWFDVLAHAGWVQSGPVTLQSDTRSTHATNS